MYDVIKRILDLLAFSWSLYNNTTYLILVITLLISILAFVLRIFYIWVPYILITQQTHSSKTSSSGNVQNPSGK